MRNNEQRFQMTITTMNAYAAINFLETNLQSDHCDMLRIALWRVNWSDAVAKCWMLVDFMDGFSIYQTSEEIKAPFFCKISSKIYVHIDFSYSKRWVKPWVNDVASKFKKYECSQVHYVFHTIDRIGL